MNLIPTGQRKRSALLLQAFLKNKSPATLRAYRQDLEDFQSFVKASSLEQAAQLLLGQSHGQANLLAFTFKAHLKAKGLSPTTINRKLAGLRSLVKLANTLGLVPWKLEIPNETAEAYRDTRGPGEAAFKNILERAGKSHNPIKAVRDRALLRLLHDLALRRSSLVNLDMADLELDRKALWVTLKKRGEKKLKTLPKTTQQALEAWLKVRGNQPGAVFTNLDRAGKGQRLTGTGIYYLVRGYGKQVGVVTRPHGIRHTAITEAVKKAQAAGIGLDEVLEFSDHRNLTTLMIYRDRERDVQGQLSRLISGEIEP